jgi:predicted small secreted protein
MKLYRLIPLLLVALSVLVLVSACGGKGGGGY